MARKKAIDETSSTINDSRPRRQQRERIPSSVLSELWSIWRADPRVPSITSRRSWAISRNANPRSVDGWFSRRRTCAKKAGQQISDESYDLPLDPPVDPKREPSPTPIEPELGSIFDPPSEDTLVLVYPPYIDELDDLEASSDTAFEDPFVEPKRAETPAYTEVLGQPRTEYEYSQPELQPSTADLEVTRWDDILSLENSAFPVCNQGQGMQSDFTCILCSTKPAQDEVVPPRMRLDFNPDTLSELSAIPFLFRTPRIVLPDIAVDHRTMDSWTVVEDELRRLVDDGKLDFSFLDVPHLASMELPD